MPDNEGHASWRTGVAAGLRAGGGRGRVLHVRVDVAQALAVAQLLVLRAQAGLAVRLRAGQNVPVCL
jgi:hypothetical protein